MNGQPDGPGAMLAFAFDLALFGFVVCLASCAISRIVDRFRRVNQLIRDMPLSPEPTRSHVQTTPLPQQRQESRT